MLGSSTNRQILLKVFQKVEVVRYWPPRYQVGWKRFLKHRGPHYRPCRYCFHRFCAHCWLLNIHTVSASTIFLLIIPEPPTTYIPSRLFVRDRLRGLGRAFKTAKAFEIVTGKPASFMTGVRSWSSIHLGTYVCSSTGGRHCTCRVSE